MKGFLPGMPGVRKALRAQLPNVERAYSIRPCEPARPVHPLNASEELRGSKCPTEFPWWQNLSLRRASLQVLRSYESPRYDWVSLVTRLLQYLAVPRCCKSSELEITAMRASKAWWFLALILLVTPLAQADSTTTVQFTGVNGANDGVYYVSPYNGTINYGTSNAQSVVLFCDDINNEVSFGQVWNANVTSLASGNFSNTRYGNGSVNPNLGGMNPQTLYDEAAWITAQFASHPADYVSLQYALWDLMTPGAERTSYSGTDGITVSQWLALAAADYGQINPAGFAILTNLGPVSYTGQVQEFIVPTPDPPTIALLLAGIIGMMALLHRRQRIVS